MAMDYAEQLLQSIDTVISARLGDLAYDKTIVCTIVNSSERESGKYTVTDGSMTFEAYSDKDNYSDNMQVQVVIPGGDWTLQKTIVGRCATEDMPITYRSPTADIMNKTGNLARASTSGKLIANSDEKNEEINIIKGKNYDRKAYDTLCIKADFRSWLENYNITSGSYGIEVVINDKLFCLLDSSRDMFGAVYNFTDWVSQEQAYKISEDIDTIETIDIKFYQSQDFKYINENGEEQPLEQSLDYNLFVQNLNIYLGAKAIELPEIYTNDSLIYSPEDKEKTIKIRWNDSFENSTIKWFIDNYSGIATEVAKFENKQEINFDCYTSLTHMNVYATVTRAENSEENQVTYKTNVLTFNNRIEKTNTIPNTDLQIRISNDKNTFDSYSCYDQGYNILDQENKLSRILQIEWISPSGTINQSFWNNATVKWEVPESNTMITSISPVNIEKREESYSEEIDSESTKNSWKILHIQDQDITCTYKIANKYSADNTNNTIKCVITVSSGEEDEIVYNLEKKISFSYKYINPNKPEQEEPPKIIIQDIADEKANDIYSYLDGEEYLTQEKTFNALTNKGAAQGIFKDDQGNLYINGSYIATGILRSNNWDGKLTYHPENGNPIEYDTIEAAEAAVEQGKASWDGEWSLSATAGTYWNLNNGQLFAKKFEVNVWDNNSGGLYLNSAPLGNQSYFRVGSPNDNNFFDYDSNGNFTIQTNDKFVLNAWKGSDTSYQGVYLNSNAANDTKIYFRAGSGKGDVTTKDIEAENLIQVDTTGVKIAANQFTLKANNIYLDSETSWFKVGNDNNYMEYNNSNLDIKGTITANWLTANVGGQIGGWTIAGEWLQTANIHAPPPSDNLTSHDGIAMGIDLNGVPIIAVRKWHGTGWYDYTDPVFINGKTGEVSITGTINANAGRIGGWDLWYDKTPIQGIPQSSLTAGEFGKEYSIHLYTAFTGGLQSIAGGSSDSWRLTIGSNFGVEKDGNLYCIGGCIGGWNILTDGLYSINTDTNQAIYLYKSGTVSYNQGQGSYTGPYMRLRTILPGSDTCNLYLTPQGFIYNNSRSQVGDSSPLITWEKLAYAVQ